MSNLILKAESHQLIGAFYEVHRNLLAGFLESVYQEALAMEFHDMGIPFAEHWGINIFYKGKLMQKKFFADFFCFDKIIIELKAAESLVKAHESQLINYLKATGMPLGFLVNFGESSLIYKRFANTRK